MSDSINHAIIGTAGHIDHGKTALVKALTGLDVDTLAEEKRRGITIELGFAFMDTPGFEKQIVFIDVPGHEKLIKTMVAGAANLDAALLVVAADEGVSVQTREHFDILRVLGIEKGVVALTKSDLVDQDRIEAVTGQVRELTAGSFLRDAPIIPVSSLTGEGIDQLRAALIEAARGVRQRRTGGAFRMPIDRAFTMHGFGTVIAGTILSGEVNVGDKLEILPDGLTTRVRAIQVQARSVARSPIGTRTAINLQDVKKEQLRRGQTACAPGSVSPTTRIDARLHVLNSYSQELKNRTRVRLHVGADEVMCRVALLDCDKVEPGGSALVQLILESETVTVPRDRYVIRTFSSMETIGGGVVLDAQPAPHKRMDHSTIDSLAKREGGLGDTVEQAFLKSGAVPLSISDAAAGIGEGEADAAAAVDEMRASGKLVQIAPRSLSAPRDLKRETYLHSNQYSALSEKLTGIISDYYTKNPYRYYMPSADLQSRFLKLAGKPVYDALVADLQSSGTLRIRETRIGLADRAIGWKPGERQNAEKIARVYEEAGFAAPPEEEVAAQLRISGRWFENLMTALTDAGTLVRISDKVTYHESVVAKVRSMVVKHIKEKGGITAAELRDILGLSRKYAISILEYLDAVRVTRRLEDKRVLR